jgi:hypothetical protein
LYDVPVNIYNETMPDSLAIRLGRLMNELQSVCASANFLDDARYISNLKRSILEKGKQTEACTFELINKAITAHMSMARPSGVLGARRTFSNDWIRRLMTMKLALGQVCFNFAESLQEVDKIALKVELGGLGFNDLITFEGDYDDEDCFVPHKLYIVRPAFGQLNLAFKEGLAEAGDRCFGSVIFAYLWAVQLTSGSIISKPHFNAVIASFKADLLFEKRQQAEGPGVVSLYLHTPSVFRKNAMDHRVIDSFVAGTHMPYI